MTNLKNSSDATSPMLGVHDIYESKVFSTMNHPLNVGLQTQDLPPKYGEHSRVRIFGTIEHDVVDTHDNKFMADNKVLYKRGHYDFIAVQKEPENWAGWF